MYDTAFYKIAEYEHCCQLAGPCGAAGQSVYEKDAQMDQLCFMGTCGAAFADPVLYGKRNQLIPSGEVIPQNIVTSQAPAIHSGIPVVNDAVNPVVTQQVIQKENNLQTVMSIASRIWLAGMIAMLLYGVISHIVLLYQVRVSIRKDGNMFICDDVESPFILGVFSSQDLCSLRNG